jgi:GTP-binding protein YchF
MEAGIVGLPNVGKSTLFNALTEAKAEASNYPFCTIEPNVGVVAVPDPNLEFLRSKIESQKVVPSIVKIVDIAGLVKGASEGAGLGNKFLSHIRETDAIMQVVRCFVDENITHVDGTVDPRRDIETIETELMLADLQSAEQMLQKARKSARGGDKEAQARLSVLEKAEAALAAGRPVRTLVVEGADERKALRTLGFLSGKEVLYIANVAEDDLQGEGPLARDVRALAAERGARMVCVCANLEAQLVELAPEDRQTLLAEYGMTEPALAVVIRAAYDLLGLQSYYTAGPQEIRAWPIPRGATAPQAAGVIHSDFERGFIRAEIYGIEDLRQFGSEAAIRAAGKLRVEGKEYVMRPGDVCHFLFNV